MPAPRQRGSVPPPQSVANDVPPTKRTQPAHTTSSAASATTIRIASRSAASSASRLSASQRRSSSQIAHSSAAIRSRSQRSLHLAQGQALRAVPGSAERDVGGGDQDGLAVLRLESRGPQAPRQVGRPVVTVLLPLERLAACAEHLDLAPDQRIELLALEAARDRGRRRTRLPGAPGSAAAAHRARRRHPRAGGSPGRRGARRRRPRAAAPRRALIRAGGPPRARS